MDAIQVSNVHKSFKVYYDKGSTLKERLLFRKRNRYENHEVLKGITLCVKEGEVVGLIGQNGCGKSTLLKLMTRIIYPDQGSILINGKISSLLELGAGFHPDMSGRENIYINASIFGLKKAEIDWRLNDIIGFSELGEYIDNPVRTYSSGMYMRLAFSVAINVDADILLIDEILAVGDTNFQRKCFDKINQLKAIGKTIVIVSHDMTNLKRLCDTIYWVKDGEIELFGEPTYVVDQYIEDTYTQSFGSVTEEITEVENISQILGEEAVSLEEYKSEDNGQDKGKDESQEVEYGSEQEEGESQTVEDRSVKRQKENRTDQDQDETEINTYRMNEKMKRACIAPARWGKREVEILEVQLLNKEGEKQGLYKYGEYLEVKIEFCIRRPVKELVFGFGMFLPTGERCYGTNTEIDNKVLDITKVGEIQTLSLCIENLYLTNGEYCLNIGAHTKDGYNYDYLNRTHKFNVYSSRQDIGIFKPVHEWR